MIVAKIKAGLGNQMFQYALGKRLSLLWNDTLKFDLSWFDNIQPGETARDMEIKEFCIDFPMATQSELQQVAPSAVSKMLEKVKGRFDRNYFFRFRKSLLKQKENLFLDGYFQSYKYFDEIRSTLVRDFSLKDDFGTEAARTLSQIQSATQSVSMHVRRGDFAASCKDWNGLCSLEYYQQALAHIKKVHPEVTIFMFSDDIAWVKENFSFDSYMELVSRPGLSAVEEMLLMSRCDHQIIANSTFSWWGAWLNQNVDKIVVSPSRWLVAADIKTTDLIPPEWIQI